MQQKHFKYDLQFLLVVFYQQQVSRCKGNINTKRMKTRIQRIKKLYINTEYAN